MRLSQLPGILAAAIGSFCSCLCQADEPTAVCLFPAGGQRGTTTVFRVAGHYLHDRCEFRMDGDGVQTVPQLQRCRSTVWFEGPVLPLPDSQQKEDYPVDHEGSVVIAADATPGVRWWRVATSQGVTAGLPFVIGDLPEVIENEIDGEPIPELVQLPLTINGRIFPRQDRDLWSFDATPGQNITCEVTAARIQSPLDSRLTLFAPDGSVVAMNDDASGRDSRITFQAAAAGRYQLQIEDADQGGLQHYVYRLTIAAEASSRLPGPGLASQLDVTDLAELLEAEPNDTAEAATPATVDAVLNGRIQQPGDVDCWRVEFEQGAAVELDLRAARLNSPLDSVLSVSDAAGRSLAENDDFAQAQTDSLLQFTAPATGSYIVSIRDRFPNRGGAAFGYRLHARSVRSLSPDFELTSALDSARVLRGNEFKLKVTAIRKYGFAGEIRVEAAGLPDGVSCEAVTIEKGKSEGTLVFRATPQAPVSLTALRLVGRGADGDRQLEHPVIIRPPSTALASTPVRDRVWLAVSVATPFRITGTFETRYAARGSTFVRHYRIERGDYTGPLTVRLSERQNRHLQGVTGPEIVVPAEASEFDYTVFLPPWMEIGRTSRTCLMGVGMVTTEDGRQHPVSYTSFEQNDQIIVLVDPERMSLHLPQTSLRAIRGATVEVPFEVRRGRGVSGPVEVQLECPQHIRGVSSTAVLLPENASAGTLTLHFAEESAGPWNMPLKISARCESPDQQFRAEAVLQVGEGTSVR